MRTPAGLGWPTSTLLSYIVTFHCSHKFSAKNIKRSFWNSFPADATVSAPDEAIVSIPSKRIVPMFTISDAIRRTQTVDGGILLDVHHGQMFCLNVVGSKILELIQRGYDEPQIADEISRDYGASREVVRADVLDFIETLHKHHILQPVRAADVT